MRKRKKEMNVSFAALLDDCVKVHREKKKRKLAAKLARLAAAARACFV